MRRHEQLPHRRLHSPHLQLVMRRRLSSGAVVVWRREQEARERAAVDQGGRQVVAERGGSNVDGELGEREVTVPAVLAAVGVGDTVSLMTPLAPSTLVLVFLW